MAQERCMSWISYGLAVSLAYPSGEEEGNFLVQMISTCLRYAYRGGGVGTLWPFLTLLAGKKVVFLTPLPRYRERKRTYSICSSSGILSSKHFACQSYIYIEQWFSTCDMPSYIHTRAYENTFKMPVIQNLNPFGASQFNKDKKGIELYGGRLCDNGHT